MIKIEEIKQELISNKNKKKIVFPEGQEEIIQKVANYLVENKIAEPILLFNDKKDIPKTLNSQVKILNLEDIDTTTLANQFFELRKGKVTIEDAKKLMRQRNYFGAMMMQNNESDSMLCGLTFTTADTLRPALQIIKTSPSALLATSVFIMKKDDQTFFFSDCALNIKPTSEQLVSTGKMVAKFAKQMQVKNPEVAFLSYSTNGSGAGEDVDRVNKAVEILKNENVDFIIEGEMQFDAAFDKKVRDKKFPNNKLTKNTPDVFIFPEIQSGNIGYKIAQRMGG